MRKNTTSKPVPKQGMPPVSVVSTSVYSGPLPPSVEFAFIITIAAFILAGVCFYFGHAKAGVGIFGVTLATIVGTFIYGTNSDKREREAKHEKAHQVRKPSTT